MARQLRLQIGRSASRCHPFWPGPNIPAAWGPRPRSSNRVPSGHYTESQDTHTPCSGTKLNSNLFLFPRQIFFVKIWRANLGQGGVWRLIDVRWFSFEGPLSWKVRFLKACYGHIARRLFSSFHCALQRKISWKIPYSQSVYFFA